MRLSIDERILSMAAWTAPWMVPWTRVCKFAPLVTCCRLTVLALDPCRVLTGAAVDTTTAVEPVGVGIWLVEGVDIFTSYFSHTTVFLTIKTFCHVPQECTLIVAHVPLGTPAAHDIHVLCVNAV